MNKRTKKIISLCGIIAVTVIMGAICNLGYIIEHLIDPKAHEQIAFLSLDWFKSHAWVAISPLKDWLAH